MISHVQKTRWTTKALPAALLFLHRSKQRRQTGERGPLQQHGAAQHTSHNPSQLCFPEPDPKAAARNQNTEDPLAADPTHGEKQCEANHMKFLYSLFSPTDAHFT